MDIFYIEYYGKKASSRFPYCLNSNNPHFLVSKIRSLSEEKETYTLIAIQKDFTGLASGLLTYLKNREEPNYLILSYDASKKLNETEKSILEDILTKHNNNTS